MNPEKTEIILLDIFELTEKSGTKAPLLTGLRNR